MVFDDFSVFIGLIFTAAVVITLLKSIRIVPQSENHNVERLGKFDRTLGAGLHILIPFIETVTRRVSILQKQISFDQMAATTKDNVTATIEACVFYRVTNAEKSQYRVDNVETAVMTTVIGKLRNTVGRMTVDEVISERSRIAAEVMTDIAIEVTNWGVEVATVEILDIGFGNEVSEAMRKQLTAERERRATVTKAEGEREAAQLQADAEFYNDKKDADAHLYKETKEAEAQLISDAKKAEGIKLLTDAQEDNIRRIAAAMADADGQRAANYILALEQTKAMGQLSASDNAKLVMLPTDAVQGMGSMAGAASLLSELVRK